MEVKQADAPTLSPSMRIALTDLKQEEALISHWSQKREHGMRVLFESVTIDGGTDDRR